jgi:PST family polysaccharide transporter
MAEEIKKQLFSGVAYTALAKYSGIIITLVVSGILARLLSPDDFGVVAIATVIISFFSLFTDMGISPAIVQNKTLTRQDLCDIFSFTLWMGLILAAIFFAGSELIATYYENSALAPLCRLLSINLFFSAANIVPNALFYKNKEFKLLAIRTFVIQVVCGALAVGAAFAGAGIYALTINPILSGVFVFIVCMRKYPLRPSFTLGLTSLRKIFSYSAYQFLFSIINYFSRNLDKLLIGKHLSMSDLGFYEKSYRLMMLPLQNITAVITPVMHPIFSDFQNDLKKLAASYENVIKILAFIGAPLTAYLYFNSRELMLLIFGSQWVQSVPVFSILALSVGVQVVMSSSGSIYQAAGDTRSLFICGLFSSVLNVGGIMLGVFYWGTLNAVAWCIVVTFTINFVQCYWQMYFHTFKRSIVPFVKQLISPAILGVVSALVLWPIDLLTADINIFISFCIKSATELVVFVAYIQLTKELDIIGEVKKRLLHH